MGGGSRADIASLGPLRAVAAVVLAGAVLAQTDRSLRRVAVPLAIIGALGLWMALQLLPLPPGLWTALPGREGIAELGALTGLGETWRPLTFSPMKTANSLASLVVPLAGLMLLALLDDRGWRRLPWVFIIAGAASALFGIAQMLLPGARGFYLYAITNDGSAVGLFSNRNHNAIFLSIALMLCVIRMEQIRRKSFAAPDLGVILAGVVILAGLLINASRTGLVGLGLVGMVFVVRALLHWREEQARGRGKGMVRLFIGGLVGIASLALLAVFAVMGRSPAVERMLALDPAQDQRVEVLPVVMQMLVDFQPLGVGFGAFEYAFRTLEPDSMLGPRYLNNAHNDWLQWPIEGGLPAIVLALVVITLFVRRTLALVRARNDGSAMRASAVTGCLILLVLAIASVVDYPLRTPSIMLLAVAAAAMLFKPLAGGDSGRRSRSR